MDRTRTPVALITIALLALASACATGTGVATPGTGMDAPLFGGTPLGSDCDYTGGIPGSTPELTRLPADAVLVAATRCVFEAQLVPGDGEWQMKLEQRADAGLPALAAALRRPDEPTAVNQPCPAVGYLPVIITVTVMAADSAGKSTSSGQPGHQLKPRLPLTTCGGPQRAATDAIAALNWSTVKTTKAWQTRTELEISSGCPGQYKPTLAITAGEAVAGTGPLAPPVNLPASPLQVCRYTLDPSSTLSMAGSAPVAMGRLASSSTLDKLASDRFLAAIVAAPAAAICHEPQAPFALVFSRGSVSPSVAVELGGCYRALVDSDGPRLRQLDAQTVSALGA